MIRPCCDHADVIVHEITLCSKRVKLKWCVEHEVLWVIPYPTWKEGAWWAMPEDSRKYYPLSESVEVEHATETARLLHDLREELLARKWRSTCA